MMAIVRSAGHTRRMDRPASSAGAPVVVAVTPRLLCDAVRRALQLDGIASHEAEDGLAVRYDVAVVSAGREQDVRARTVITLAGEGDAVDADRVADLVTLRAVLADARAGSVQ